MPDLWVQYLAVGGGLDLFTLEAYLHGLAALPAGQQDVLANALNDRLDDLDQAGKIPYLHIVEDTEPRRENAVDVIDELLGPYPSSEPVGSTVESPGGRLAWLEAQVDVSQQLLSLGLGVGRVAHDIIEHVRRLSHARTVTFVGPSGVDEAQFEVRIAVGVGASNLVNKSYEKWSTLEGRAMVENCGFLSTAQASCSHHLEADAGEPAGPLLVVAFDGPEGEQGAIIASRGQSQDPFSEAELAMAEDFARQCGIALRLVDAQASREQLQFREQRDAVTRVLHDDLIQQLFGLGVTLEAYRTTVHPPVGTAAQSQDPDLWHQAVNQIDAIISQLRSTLTAAPDPDH